MGPSEHRLALESAREAWEEGDATTAFGLLLRAWRMAPTEATTALIEALDVEVGVRRGPIAGRTRTLRLAAWQAVQDEEDPADTGRLVSVLLTFDRKTAETLLTQVESRGPDPRLASALEALLHERPHGYSGWNASTFWERVTQLLVDSGDRRTLSALDGMLVQFETMGYDTTLRSYGPPLVRGARDALHTRLSVQPATENPVAEAWVAARRAPEHDLEGLLASVYADPSDLGARAVYADALQLTGDPRGEFIALQLLARRTSDQNQRMKALLARHGQEWLGALSAVVTRSGLRWRGGFPVAGVLASKLGGPQWGELDAWSTFERLDLERYWGTTQLLGENPFPVLGHITGVGPDVLSFDLPTLHTVAFSGDYGVLVSSLRESRTTTLRELFATVDPGSSLAVEFPWEAPVFESLETLTVEGDPENWVRDAHGIPGSFALHVPLSFGWTCSFAADRSVVTLRYRGARYEPANWRWTLLKDIDILPKSLTHLTVVLRKKTQRTEAELSEVGAALHQALGACEVELPEPNA